MQADVRLLSPAVEPYMPSRPRTGVDILGSLIAGLLLGALAAIGLEMATERRVLDPDDMTALPGVPVIGVLQPLDSRKPVYRRMTSGKPAIPMGHSTGHRPLLLGAR